MSTVPLNDRRSGPFVAAEDQTDFDADFPLIRNAATGDPEGILFVRERDGETVELTSDDWTIPDEAEDGFTLRLLVPSLDGDRCVIKGVLPPVRERQHALGGATRTDILEEDATRAQVQLQEHRRDIERSVRVPDGESGFLLPALAVRAGKVGVFDEETGDLRAMTPVEAAALLAAVTLQGVEDEGDTQVQRVIAEGDTQEARVEGAGDTQVGRVEDAGAAQAAILALINGDAYASTAAGLAGTAEGVAFIAPDGDGVLSLWLHEAGPVATLIAVIPNAVADLATYTGDEPVLVEEFLADGLVWRGVMRHTGLPVIGGLIEDPDGYDPGNLPAALAPDMSLAQYTIFVVGQSPDQGAVGTNNAAQRFVISGTQPFFNETFASPGDIDTPAAAWGPLVERDGGGNLGETPCSAWANGFTQYCLDDGSLADPATRRMFAFSAARSGSNLAEVDGNSAHFTSTTVPMIEGAQARATGQGRTHAVLAASAWLGHTDQDEGVSFDDLDPELSNFGTAISAAAIAETGQSFPVHTFLIQTGFDLATSDGYARALVKAVDTNPLMHFAFPDFMIRAGADGIHPYDSCELFFAGRMLARLTWWLSKGKKPPRVWPGRPYTRGTKFYWPFSSPKPLIIHDRLAAYVTDHGLAVEDSIGVKDLSNIHIGADENGNLAGRVLCADMDTACTGATEGRLGLDYGHASQLTGGYHHNLSDQTRDVFLIPKGSNLIPRWAPFVPPRCARPVTVGS